MDDFEMIDLAEVGPTVDKGREISSNYKPFPSMRMDFIFAPTKNKELYSALDTLYRWIQERGDKFTDIVEYERWKKNVIKALELEEGIHT